MSKFSRSFLADTKHLKSGHSRDTVGYSVTLGTVERYRYYVSYFYYYPRDINTRSHYSSERHVNHNCSLLFSFPEGTPVCFRKDPW